MTLKGRYDVICIMHLCAIFQIVYVVYSIVFYFLILGPM